MSCIQAQDKLLSTIMTEGDFFNNMQQDGFSAKLDAWMNDYHHSVQQLDFGNKD